MTKKFFLLISMIIFLAACNVNTVETEKIKMYNGRDLTIGVIGSAPDIKEKNIVFEKIDFNDLKNDVEKLSNNLDAIIIMKESLTEADDDRYVAAYHTLTIPTFFMQSTKLHVPFTNEGIDYDKFPDVDSSNYATGFLSVKTDEGYNEQTWRYQLGSNKGSKQDIQTVYTRIFNTIESVNSK
ncbi:hypothetical protein [Viridibacillus arvi]|uniref:hypothetical protein n=1 Tax=Viridibacillus arvi TaxID=263475 RepID=UPI003D27C00E